MIERLGRPLIRTLAPNKVVRLSSTCSSLQSRVRAYRVSDLLKSTTQNNIKEISTENQIEISGFVRSIRKQKKVAFAAIGDGSSIDSVQAVLKPENAESLSNGAAVKLTGKWSQSQGTGQSHELHVTKVSTFGDHDVTTYPLQKKYHSPEFLRTIPHLRVRTPSNAVLLHLRSYMIDKAQRFFSQRGYIQTHTPIITSSDCEGAGEVFGVTTKTDNLSKARHDEQENANSFFGASKYLTVSAQLHLEALAQSVGKVWTLSPTFRAEKSDTARHLSEFYMLEAEICFADSLDDITAVVEGLVREMASGLQKNTHSTAGNLGQELVAARRMAEDSTDLDSNTVDLQQRWEALARPEPWPRMTYLAAICLLQEAVASGKASFESEVIASEGLRADHEKYLAKEVGKNGPVFVTDYPKSIKPFYMAPSPTGKEKLGTFPTVACFDLLLPEVCEVAGGSMREHRYDALRVSMAEKGLLNTVTLQKQSQEGSINDLSSSSRDPSDMGLDWYLDLRKYGTAPHGGFGLGFDRLLGYLAGVSNIRDTVTFPRWHGRCIC